MRWIWLLMGILGAVVVAGCEDGGCKTDNDCKGARVCQRGACVDAKPSDPAPASSPTATETEPPTPVRLPPKAPPRPRPTCAACGDDCLDKADSINKTDPAGAKQLAGQYCTEACGCCEGVFLMRCHNYGYLLGHRFVPH